ncbi:MAG: GtrA family protein [Candidatus Paceibacterota bacterium]|jgi:putative flippase GtrA
MKRFITILNKLFLSFIPQKYTKIVKYIISGGTAAATDIGFLFLFTSIFHIWYLFSAILAFLIAFGVSFTLQKFWTFDDHGTEGLKSQAFLYFIITSINLGINTLLMYIFVDVLHIHYLLAQIFAGAIVAFQSFFVYQKFVFKKKPIENTSEFANSL